MRLDRDGDVHLLVLEEADQTFTADTVAAIDARLDEVAATSGPAALVLTGEGKTFHQGLDLPFVGGLGDGVPDFLRSVHRVFGRLHRLEVPVVTAVNGHAIAAGAMLAQCGDLRVMRADRGWYRLPEVELQLPFTVVMQALLEARIPTGVRHRLMVLGERLGGAEAAAAGVVDLAVEGEDEVRVTALARAAALAPLRGPAIATIRTALHRELLRHVDADADRMDLMAV